MLKTLYVSGYSDKLDLRRFVQVGNALARYKWARLGHSLRLRSNSTSAGQGSGKTQTVAMVERAGSRLDALDRGESASVGTLQKSEFFLEWGLDPGFFCSEKRTRGGIKRSSDLD